VSSTTRKISAQPPISREGSGASVFSPFTSTFEILYGNDGFETLHGHGPFDGPVCLACDTPMDATGDEEE